MEYRYRSWSELSVAEQQEVRDRLRAEMEDPRNEARMWERYGYLEVTVRFMTNWFTRAEFEPRYARKRFDKDDWDGAEAYLQYMRDMYEVVEAEVRKRIG